MKAADRLRDAATAAIELAESGMSCSDAVDNVRTRFDLTDAERSDVIVRAAAVLDERDRHASQAAFPVIALATRLLDVMATTVRDALALRRDTDLAAGCRLRGVATLRAEGLALGERIAVMLGEIGPLLRGASIDRAARIGKSAAQIATTLQEITP